MSSRNVRILLTVALLACVVALASSRYFLFVGNQSYFVFLSLAGATVLHLRLLPSWSELGRLALAAMALRLISLLTDPSFGKLFILLSLTGLCSIAILGLRSIWSDGPGRRLMLWGFLPSVIFVAFGWFFPLILGLTQIAHPKALDLYLYSFDCSLRFQPSFILGQAFLKWNLFGAISLWFYMALSIVISLVYADLLALRKEKPLSALLAFLCSGPIGVLFYNFFPALGPIHLFQGDFPLHPLSLTQARNLFLTSVALQGPPNAMPSLHMTWVLLAWWYSEKGSRWVRVIALAFVAFTVFSTMGSGEHYLVDLVVAVPFSVMIVALCATSLPLSHRDRIYAGAFGAALTFLWLCLLRFQPHLFWVSPVIPWTLISVTLAASFWVRRWLAKVAPEPHAAENATSQLATPEVVSAR